MFYIQLIDYVELIKNIRTDRIIGSYLRLDFVISSRDLMVYPDRVLVLYCQIHAEVQDTVLKVIGAT